MTYKTKRKTKFESINKKLEPISHKIIYAKRSDDFCKDNREVILSIAKIKYANRKDYFSQTQIDYNG